MARRRNPAAEAASPSGLDAPAPSGVVAFLGPRRDLPELYRAADFLLLPTGHDPCSLVVLEALACGLPVVSTTANGATEIMRNGEHGFVVGVADAGALAAAVAAMLDDGRRGRMRDRCLALRPELSWERHVERLLEIYDYEIGRGESRRAPGGEPASAGGSGVRPAR